jgi:hypothetical protein
MPSLLGHEVSARSPSDLWRLRHNTGLLCHLAKLGEILDDELR